MKEPVPVAIVVTPTPGMTPIVVSTLSTDDDEAGETGDDDAAGGAPGAAGAAGEGIAIGAVGIENEDAGTVMVAVVPACETVMVLICAGAVAVMVIVDGTPVKGWGFL